MRTYSVRMSNGETIYVKAYNLNDARLRAYAEGAYNVVSVNRVFRR